MRIERTWTVTWPASRKTRQFAMERRKEDNGMGGVSRRYARNFITEKQAEFFRQLLKAAYGEYGRIEYKEVKDLL